MRTEWTPDQISATAPEPWPVVNGQREYPWREGATARVVTNDALIGAPAWSYCPECRLSGTSYAFGTRARRHENARHDAALHEHLMHPEH